MTNQEILAQFGPREAMEYDVVVVGGGPGGLSTAIRLKQLAAAEGKEISVVVLEKGSEPGAHTLSGAIPDPISLNELFPNWKELGAPLNQPVTGDIFLMTTETGASSTPNMFLPACFDNHGTELVTLPLASVSGERRTIMVKGKGGRERLVPLGAPAREAIKAYLGVRNRFLPQLEKAQRFLFPSRGREGHFTRGRVAQLLKDLAVQAGIDPR